MYPLYPLYPLAPMPCLCHAALDVEEGSPCGSHVEEGSLDPMWKRDPWIPCGRGIPGSHVEEGSLDPMWPGANRSGYILRLLGILLQLLLLGHAARGVYHPLPLERHHRRQTTDSTPSTHRLRGIPRQILRGIPRQILSQPTQPEPPPDSHNGPTRCSGQQKSADEESAGKGSRGSGLRRWGCGELLRGAGCAGCAG